MIQIEILLTQEIKSKKLKNFCLLQGNSNPCTSDLKISFPNASPWVQYHWENYEIYFRRFRLRTDAPSSLNGRQRLRCKICLTEKLFETRILSRGLNIMKSFDMCLRILLVIPYELTVQCYCDFCQQPFLKGKEMYAINPSAWNSL